MPLPALQVEHLRPYAKAVVLEYTGTKPMPDALAALVAELKRMCRSTNACRYSRSTAAEDVAPSRLSCANALIGTPTAAGVRTTPVTLRSPSRSYSSTRPHHTSLDRS
jgi:hypothetical protein